MPESVYIHGTSPEEQARLEQLNRLTNPPFLAYLDLRAGERVLEVGSGLGILAAEAAGAAAAFVVGVERAGEQLTACPMGAGGPRFVRGDAHRLPFADDRFDVVYCRYVLEHVADPVGVLCEMRRVLRPGGRALAQENDNAQHRLDPDCPAFDAVWQRFNALQARLGGDAYVGKRLHALFREAGFREIRLSLQPEVHWTGEPGMETWVRNLIGNVESGAERLLAEGLATAEEIAAAIAELQALPGRGDGSALFHWNRACGVK